MSPLDVSTSIQIERKGRIVLPLLPVCNDIMLPVDSFSVSSIK